jgi:hypothetical protein
MLTTLMGSFHTTIAIIKPWNLNAKEKDEPPDLEIILPTLDSHVFINNSNLRPGDINIERISQKTNSIKPLYLQALPIHGFNKTPYVYIQKTPKHSQIDSFLFKNSTRNHLYLAEKALTFYTGTPFPKSTSLLGKEEEDSNKDPKTHDPNNCERPVHRYTTNKLLARYILTYEPSTTYSISIPPVTYKKHTYTQQTYYGNSRDLKRGRRVGIEGTDLLVLA